MYVQEYIVIAYVHLYRVVYHMMCYTHAMCTYSYVCWYALDVLAHTCYDVLHHTYVRGMLSTIYVQAAMHGAPICTQHYTSKVSCYSSRPKEYT